MAHPLTGPVIGYMSRLRFPTLFKITVGLFVLNLLIPDPIPFLDEIVMALATLVLASWRRPTPPATREGVTLEGESRRE
jgi:hypothetical protein